MYSVWCLIGSIGMTFALQKVTDGDMRGKNPSPLLDVVHANTFDLRRLQPYIDFLPILPGLATACLVFARDVSLDPILYAVSGVFGLRAICFSVTIFPAPFNKTKHVPKAQGGNHDCMYSGHTALMLLFAYVIWQTFPCLGILLLVYCALGSFLIIVTRAHYTIDVIVAWIATYAVIMSCFSKDMFPSID